jgi:hypothetical protein
VKSTPIADVAAVARHDCVDVLIDRIEAGTVVSREDQIVDAVPRDDGSERVLRFLSGHLHAELFLEGADFFSTPINAVFTRTVADPEHGRFSGKNNAFHDNLRNHRRRC